MHLFPGTPPEFKEKGMLGHVLALLVCLYVCVCTQQKQLKLSQKNHKNTQ